MAALAEVYAAHAAWVWIVLAAALLAIEAATGSGWLLWPSAAAGLTAIAVLAGHPTPVAAVLVFAGATIVLTVLGRRFLRQGHGGHGGDINDTATRLVGVRGEVVRAFVGGAGRVFIDGKEWAAELDGGETLAAGARVEVTGVAGAHLRVRPA